MKQAPSRWHVEELLDRVNEIKVFIKTHKGDKWVPARTLGFNNIRSRIKLALDVYLLVRLMQYTGKIINFK